MKQVLCIIVFIAFCTGVKAQQLQKNIEEQFLNYTHLLAEKKFDESTAYIIEDFFAIIPKEQLIAVMEKTFNDPDMTFVIDSPKLLSVSTPQTIRGKQYVKLQYSNILRMQIQSDPEPGKAPDSVYRKVVLGSLQAQFGKENVRFSEEHNTITYNIYTQKKAIARSNDNKSWKFIVVEEMQLDLLKKIIPKQLLE